MTHWKSLENPDYIGAYAFQPGEKKTVTILNVRREMVCGTDGKKEECTVVHFEESEKPLVLNVTNAKAISKAAESPYIEQWAGVRIVLGVEKVKAFGDTIDAVRVKPDKLPRKKVTLPPCEKCGRQISGTDKISAETMVNVTVKRFGRALCAECAAKQKASMKETQANEKIDQQTMHSSNE